MKIIYLKPRSTWRAELRSDTLWGLLCWGVRYIWKESRLLSMLSQFESGSPPFLISSAFPFRQENEEKVLYLPKPITQPFQLLNQEWTPKRMKAYKNFKKVTYVPLKTFQKMIKGELTEEEYFLNYESEWRRCGDVIPKRRTYVHNTVDRLGGKTGIYNAPLWGSAQQGGLYFFLKILDPEYEHMLRSLWPFFEHMGLGGDASIGRGFFRITEEEMDDFTVQGKAKRFITLSLYSPNPDEISVFSRNEGSIWYQLELRKGRVGGKLYVTNHFLKQPVVLFREGSSFPIVEKKSNFGCVQLVKNVETVLHKVYQYGYAFPIYSST